VAHGLIVTPRPRVCMPAGAEGPGADVATAGYLTARTLSRTVPPAVPGIMFLSGECFHRLSGVPASMDCLVQLETAASTTAKPSRE
jgi:hypothetical protein